MIYARKVKVSKTEPIVTSMNSGKTIAVRVWRGDADGGALQSYSVPRRDNQTVLDVVSWIQRELDPTLSYRYACRVGMCGSCAMMVNGIPRWTCRTHVKNVLAGVDMTIEPLRNLPVVKDLAADMSAFFDKWTAAQGQFHRSKTRADPTAPVLPTTVQRQAADAAIECINCGVCYAACDTVQLNPEYLGPAALNRAWSLINDERDVATELRLKAVSGAGGCHNCHSQQGCASYCPNELNPTLSIAGLKRATAKAALKGNI